MQPYFLPYIGYFQMIKAVDKFVFYDDVNYIKGGWINRNRILINGEAQYINVPQKGASPNKLINEVGVNYQTKDFAKLERTIELAYKKAPYFKDVYAIIKELYSKQYNNLAEIAARSIQLISEYLGLQTEFYVSSEHFSETKGLDKADRILAISRCFNADTYINAIGGKELYSKEEFETEGIKLQFIQSKPIEYTQFDNEFVPWLSILDVLMFNSVEEVNDMLDQYELV